MRLGHVTKALESAAAKHIMLIALKDIFGKKLDFLLSQLNKDSKHWLRLGMTINAELQSQSDTTS